MYRLHESTVQGCFWWRGPAGIDASVEIGMRMGRYRTPGEAELASLNTTAETEVVRAIGLLGGFRVSVGGRTIGEDAWRLRKAASLVKLLAPAPGAGSTASGRWTSLAHLGSKAASSNLRGAVHVARRALSPGGPNQLTSEDGALLLCPHDALWVDTEAFEKAASAARRSQNPAAFRAAIGLFGGELLPGDRHEPWTAGKREELRRTYLSLLVEPAALYGERHEHGPAINALGRAVSEEPTNEEEHAALMRHYALSGGPERALAQYERLRDALSGEPGKQPGAAIRRLRDEIASGRHGPAPSATPSSPPAVGTTCRCP